MHSSLTARKWLQMGIKYVVFFQDTNGLSFISLAATLGVSVELDLDVNSLAVPRKAKQAVGAITKLKHIDGNEMTVNVEYNQLDPLLRATINPEGDVNDPKTGLSPFPGNINQLIFKLEPYVATLSKTSGVMAGNYSSHSFAISA
jgi:UDP-sugar pyrophosphorylase